MTQPLYEWTAKQLLAAYKNGTLSPVEATRSVLDRITECEPHVHATWLSDANDALAQAIASERRWTRGQPAGPLDGVPVTLKENIATRGAPVPLGSAATPLIPAAADAPAAARLRESGAVMVAKTTMPDFGLLGAAASSFHPLSRNPWDTRLNTGGSSSGAGAAAAAGYGPLHLGTDIGGSVRIPASFCGVFGFKPSQGRVPTVPPAAARVIGPLTRTVDDAARLMSVVSSPDHRDYTSLPPQNISWLNLERSVKGLRIGLWLEPAADWQVDSQIRQAIQEAARVFERAGALVEPVNDWTTADMYLGIAHFFSMRCRIELQDMPPERAALAAGYVRDAAAFAGSLSADDVFRSFASMQAMQAATVHATQPYDYLLAPTSPVLPFAAEAINSGSEAPVKDAHFTIVFNQSGQPAASIPCGYSADGMPIGLQIAGRRHDDLGVLQMARFYESESSSLRLSPARKPPLVANPAGF
ncbi:MAG TPA: amidase [Comamonadaceae bacterium]|nr:amidase [Comamonadaceae bacterium]